ncbi:hypothetical protein [Geotalea toluenoxydans]|uniref:hypothetical protein n=1 Tax=Geotalea toluenoxydans TaxID=421624 RepID=UPI000AF59CEE|nr:hypothetical protein [Geotalea toluenoxydans]
MLTLENMAALALHLGLIMYALFGGADFGGGIWTALASGPVPGNSGTASFWPLARSGKPITFG